MKILERTVGNDLQQQADEDAVMRQWLEGIPADPEVLRRVEERSLRATAETAKIHGNIDVAALLREVREES